MACRDDMYKVTLKSWLYERINENKREERYLGLKWIDEENLIFQLPWVTENDPHWREYYKLFHDWARRDGGESTDSQKAKRNFRSALNHSKHFRNIKEQGEDLQTGSYKVYKFLTQEEITREKSRKQRNTSEDSPLSQQIVVSPVSRAFNQYDDFNGGMNMVQPNLMHGLQTQNPRLIPNQYNGHGFQNDLNTSSPPLFPGHNQIHTVAPMIGQEYLVHSVADTDMNISIIPSTDSEAALAMTRNVLSSHMDGMGKLRVNVEYNGKNVIVQEIDIYNEFGSSILFDENQDYRNQYDGNVYLTDVNGQEEPGLRKILENMKRGLHLSFDSHKLQINVRRDCLAHAYYFTVQGQKPGNLQAIKRKQEYPIFSFETLVNSLNEPFQEATSSLPAICSNIEIVVGVQPKHDQHGKCVKGVKITLHSHAALKISTIRLGSDEIMISHTEQVDSEEQSVELMNCD